MKIFKTLIGSEDGKLRACDTIEHEGKLWLVPHWTVAPTEGWRQPTRIIRMDSLPHQKMPENYADDFVLNGPIPKGVLLCEIPPEESHGFEVIDLPDIKLHGGDKLN